MLAPLLAAVVAVAAEQHPLGWTDKKIELSYVELAHACQDAKAISGLLNVNSVVECETKCDVQAAAAPGTGEPACVGVDTNGAACYLKSRCDGNAGSCKVNDSFEISAS